MTGDTPIFRRKLILWLFVFVTPTLAACGPNNRTTAPPVLSSSAVLQQDEDRKSRWTYRAPSVDPVRYRRFIIEPVAVLTGPAASFGSMSEEDRQRLAVVVGEEFNSVIAEKYPVVTEPDRDVKRIRLTLLGVNRTIGGLATVMRVIPKAIVMNAVKSTLIEDRPGSFTGYIEIAIETFDGTDGTLLTADIQKEHPAFFDMEATLSTTDTVRSSARRVALALRESLETEKQSRADQGATTP